jgi:uncharacterized phage-like protein YoqJ
VYKQPASDEQHQDRPAQFNNLFDRAPQKEESFEDNNSPVGQTFHEHIEHDMMYTHPEPESSQKNEEALFEKNDFLMESNPENEQMKDLSNRASQDYVIEKLKDMDQNRYLINHDESDSEGRFVPKQVDMPPCDESESE